MASIACMPGYKDFTNIQAKWMWSSTNTSGIDSHSKDYRSGIATKD